MKGGEAKSGKMVAGVKTKLNPEDPKTPKPARHIQTGGIVPKGNLSCLILQG